MIDIDAVAGAEFVHDPFTHAVVEAALSGPEARVLAEEFPTTGFRDDRREERPPGTGPAGVPATKQYRMQNLQVVVDDEVLDSVRSLTPAWRGVIDQLVSPAYREAVARASGADVGRCRLEARLVRYGPGHWISPHTDRPDKVLTQLFYVNPRWEPGWKGALRLLRGPDLDDCAREILPRLGTSVLMVRSDHSWHAVPPVSAYAPDRRSLLVHFTRS